MMRLGASHPAVAVVALMALLVGTGCVRTARRPEPRPGLSPNTSPVIPPAPPPVTPPPPSEIDLAMEAATRAQSGGDKAAALQLYQKAAALEEDGGRRAEIHFTMGLLYAEPGLEARDLERSRAELQRAVSDAPAGPRAAEARLLASLLDELIQLRAQAGDLKTQSEAARAETAALKTRLEEKEKELAGLKRILLQDKGMP